MLTFGAWIQRLQANDTLIQDQYGQASFTNLNSFLQGTVSTYTFAPNFTPLGWRSLEGAFYAEDSIRVKPSLEMRIGFRAESTNGWNEVNGRASNYRFDSTGVIATNPTVGTSALAENNAKFLPAPRFGLAWSPFGSKKTVIRGGFGTYYALLDNLSYRLDQNGPFNTVSAVKGIPFSTIAPDATYKAAKVIPSGVQPDLRTPTVESWSLKIEQQIASIATFGAMYLIGYTLDNLSLMALTIATGFVVDDAIVVIENITRHLESGMRPMEAALRGAEEIGFTVLSMSISLVAVFIPILMMSGIVGRLFREFAVVLSAAIAISMVVSLTVTPMMCAWLLKEHRGEHGYLYRQTERLYQWIISTYGAALEVALDHPAAVLLSVLLTMAANVYLYARVPKGFFPQQDTGRLFGNVVGEQHISYQALVDKAKWFEEQVRTDPDVETVTMVAGTSGGGFGGNSANMNVQLRPLGERASTSDQVLARLRRKTTGLPGATMFLQNAQDVRIGGRQGNAQYQYTLQGPDFASLDTWGPRVLDRLSRLPEIADVSSDQQTSGLSSNVVIDRDTASRLGLTAQAVDSALYDAFGQRQVSVMYKSINQYHVVLALEQRWWESPNFLSTIYVQTPRGTDVPLSTFTHFTQGITPIRLTHQGQFPATTLSFNLGENVPLSDAVDAINKTEVEMGLPASITGKFAGTAQAYQEALDNQPILIATALIAVYIVLGMLYESLIHPLTIISTLPSAGLGALVAMVLFKSDLDIIGMIGIILLIGIVKKNAIMMIDFALAAERNDGMSSRDAIYRACLLRFRPIMMTTMCALLGAMPMALGWGAGAELRKPLGIAIVGGLVVSQMLTLFTTPVIYLYLDRLRQTLRWRLPAFRHRPGILVPGGVAGSVDQ